MSEVKLRSGKIVKVREPTLGDRRAAEQVARRPHPTLAAMVVDETAFSVEMVKRLTDMPEKELNELPDSDFTKLVSAYSIYYVPESRRAEVKAFLEQQSEGNLQPKDSSLKPQEKQPS